MDAIDELVARSKDHKELQRFHKLHQDHPELLEFLVQAIRARLALFDSFSYHSLWEYARWKLEMDKGPEDTFLMNDHCAPYYARAITILHPEFNGKAESRECTADELFGLELEPEKLQGDYARRLRWADGTALQSGWKPTSRRKPPESDPHTTQAHREAKRI
jgi:hypothetical protein